MKTYSINWTNGAIVTQKWDIDVMGDVTLLPGTDSHVVIGVDQTSSYLASVMAPGLSGTLVAKASLDYDADTDVWTIVPDVAANGMFSQQALTVTVTCLLGGAATSADLSAGGSTSSAGTNDPPSSGQTGTDASSGNGGGSTNAQATNPPSDPSASSGSAGTSQGSGNGNAGTNTPPTTGGAGGTVTSAPADESNKHRKE